MFIKINRVITYEINWKKGIYCSFFADSDECFQCGSKKVNN